MSTPYPASLKAVGGARPGIAPVNLLDVQDVNGNLYYWSDRPSNAPFAITGQEDVVVNAAPPLLPIPPGKSVAWSLPTVATTSIDGGGGTVSASPAGGLLVSLAPGGVAATWKGFSIPAGVPESAITGVYYVMILTGSMLGPAAVYLPITTPTDMNGQYSNGPYGLGPDWAAGIAAISLTATMVRAWYNPASAGAQMLQVSFVGVAIYYTTPTTPPVPPYPWKESGWNGPSPYLPWIIGVPKFTFHRSLVTDVGNFVLQNLSGDTLQRDFERLMRRSALEGALFVYRCWQPDAEAAWLEVHGKLTVDDVGTDTVSLRGENLISPAQEDTPLEIYSETCQLNWGGPRCGSTQPTECQYSFQTCQVPERIMVALNDYEKNYGEATANTALKVINRARRI
jgi:hypothetical protein